MVEPVRPEEWMRDVDRATIIEGNECIQRLTDRRLAAIEGHAFDLPSRAAWKTAVFSMALLYRAVMLADATCLNWNHRNVLGSLLSARALVETIALFLDFETEMKLACQANDVSRVDAIASKRLFWTRDEVIIAAMPENEATNINTIIKRIDKKQLPGLWQHYSILSERCHPNSFGHRGMFSNIDHATRVITFDEHGTDQQHFDYLLGIFPLLRLYELSIKNLEGFDLLSG